MKIVKTPKVYLVARTQMVPEGIAEFLTDQKLNWNNPVPLSDADRLIELAGRVCYMSFGKKGSGRKNKEYIENLLSLGDSNIIAHGSVCEHPTFSFLVCGAGRGFSHEQVRHRAGWAYSQLSTRYCDFEREDTEGGTWEPGFTIPPMAQLSPGTEELISDQLWKSRAMYVELLGAIEADLKGNEEFVKRMPEGFLETREGKRALRKAARGAARDILPIATEAIMVMTANVRSIWNTLVLRGSAEAEAQIRMVYVQIARIMIQESPNVFGGIKFDKAWDGSEVVIMPRQKI